jgi:gliding motility-associated-like protein
MPNAFSPNGDGFNDGLFVISHEVADLLEYSIYNRWGEQVFTTDDLANGWDGTYNGKEAGIGTYVYLIRALGIGGEQIQVQGNVILVR